MRFLNPHLIAKKYIDKARFNYLEINYYRLLLPWILQNYDKVINLGADIIIQRNIAELYEVQLSDDEFIAGAPDLGYHGRLAIDISPKELGKKDPFTYVNAMYYFLICMRSVNLLRRIKLCVFGKRNN